MSKDLDPGYLAFELSIEQGNHSDSKLSRNTLSQERTSDHSIATRQNVWDLIGRKVFPAYGVVIATLADLDVSSTC